MKAFLTGTALAALLAAPALAADGKPLAKDCGPNNDYVIGFSQANFKEPYREHVNHELERLVKTIRDPKIADFLKQSSQDALYTQFIGGLRDEAGIRINQQALSSILNLNQPAQ